MPSYETIVRENIDNIRYWRAEGFTASQIASKIGMSVRTLYLYLRTIPELKDAWDVADTYLVKERLEPALVEQALYGMPYIETTEERMAVLQDDGSTRYEMVVTKKVHKRVYSPAILKYVLSCLEPSKWGKHEIKEENKILLAEETDRYGI